MGAMLVEWGRGDVGDELGELRGGVIGTKEELGSSEIVGSMLEMLMGGEGEITVSVFVKVT